MTTQSALNTILNSCEVTETIGDIHTALIFTGKMEIVVTWTWNDNGDAEVIHISA